VAATYDHAAAARAARRGEQTVFVRIAGARTDVATVRAAIVRIRGVRRDSARVSAEPPAASFAIDPTRQSARGAGAALGRSLGASLQVTLVRWPAADAGGRAVVDPAFGLR